MAFGIGTNSQEANAGAVRGEQKEIACECWFTSTGKMIPKMVKVQDDDGVVHKITRIQVHSQAKKNYAGTPSVEFDCTLIVLNQQLPARLIYYQMENRWVMNLGEQKCAAYNSRY